MGVVYEAEHESLKSRVALKVVQPRFRADPKYLRRFHAEARVAAGLHHTNIVTVFDYGDHDGVCYYAMQYIQGQPLDRVLADIRRLRDEGTEANVVLGPEAIVTIRGGGRIRPPIRCGERIVDRPLFRGNRGNRIACEHGQRRVERSGSSAARRAGRVLSRADRACRGGARETRVIVTQ